MKASRSKTSEMKSTLLVDMMGMLSAQVGRRGATQPSRSRCCSTSSCCCRLSLHLPASRTASLHSNITWLPWLPRPSGEVCSSPHPSAWPVAGSLTVE